MESVQKLHSSLRMGDWLINLDLQAHHHKPIYQASRKYQRVAVKPKKIQIPSSSVPDQDLLFTSVTTPVIIFAHLQLFRFISLPYSSYKPDLSQELNWRIHRNHVMSDIHLVFLTPEHHLFMDASDTENLKIQGLLNASERDLHINCQEMKAIIYALGKRKFYYLTLQSS